MTSQGSVLFVLASHGKHPNGNPTGWYLPEAAHPYYEVKPHYDVVFASIKGGKAPLDPTSVEGFKDDEGCKKFLNDQEAQKAVSETVKLGDVDTSAYKAIFFVGGHGPMHESKEKDILSKAGDFYQSGKLVAAVCHGPGALVEVTGKDGKNIFDGRNVTGFSNEEEEQAGLTDQVPFLLETQMKKVGGKYNKAAQAWGECLQVDGNVITGQNPASAAAVGKAIVEYLSKH